MFSALHISRKLALRDVNESPTKLERGKWDQNPYLPHSSSIVLCSQNWFTSLNFTQMQYCQSHKIDFVPPTLCLWCSHCPGPWSSFFSFAHLPSLYCPEISLDITLLSRGMPPSRHLQGAGLYTPFINSTTFCVLTTGKYSSLHIIIICFFIWNQKLCKGRNHIMVLYLKAISN